jgi:hypothetical protein
MDSAAGRRDVHSSTWEAVRWRFSRPILALARPISVMTAAHEASGDSANSKYVLIS